MTSATLGATILQIHRLFDEGSVAGLSDGQLLERFVDSRDERAFEAIVNRHGPMVLATCRAVLKDRHASEDAFQSAFASLARRASTLRNADALGGWLHRVAYREAVRAGSEAARRRAIERKAPPATRAEQADLGELRAIVHAELDRLPESLRLPVVLCDLEGLTKGQAAQHLGWTEGAVRGRLERARGRLRSRLARRGLGTSAAFLVGSIGGEASAEVGAARVASALRAALAAGTAAGASVAGWLKAGATLVGVGLVGIAGFGLMGRPGAGDQPKSAPPPARAGKAASAEAPVLGETVEVVGRVVDPEGKPVVGAIVRLQPSPTSLPREPEPTSTSGVDGRFSVRGPRWSFLGREPWWGAQVVASSPGFGPGRAFVGHVVESPGEVTVPLVADDLPIEGRVVDLEGRAVAGASVRVSDVYVPTGGDLSKWLDKVRRYGTRGPWQGTNTRDLDYLPNLPGVIAATGPDGRFRLLGIGRERIAALIISGPGIATEEVHAMTRPGPSVKTADRGPGESSLIFHAAKFEHVAAPTRAIQGVITDKDTGAPLAGVKVEGTTHEDRSISAPGVEATTGPDGEYRLLGLGQATRYRLFVKPSPERPYIPASLIVDAGPIAPSLVKHDITLKRGVLVRGRVTDKATGRPVERAVLWPYTFADNPRVAEYPGYRSSERQFVRSDAQGRFAIATLPGRGLIAAQADFDRYLLAKGFEAIAGYDPEQRDFRTYPSICSARNHHAIVEIRPEAGLESFTCDIQVDPGSTMTGVVLDPEGREVSGLLASHLGPFGNLAPRPHESARFEASGVDPARPRRASFFHEGRKLAGSIVIPGDGPGPAIVRLQPWGVVTGRVVDDEGNPRSGFSLGNGPAFDRFDPDRGFVPTNERIELDREGRFRIERLVPGLAYKVYATKDIQLHGPIFEGLRVGPGEVKDVGDVKITPFRE